jgi:hypothetical protein
MQKIVLAAAGNTRGLKQLGIVIDQMQIKFEAMKLGLISTTKDAITPGIKAQAIYAIATKNLGDYMAQAKAHAGDYANSQRRLAAEWDNTKDAIGAKLLPAFARASNFLAKNLPNAVALAGVALGDLAAEIRPTAHAIKAVFDAIVPASARSKVALIALGIALGGLVAVVFPVTTAIVALGIGLREAYKHSATFRNAVHAIGQVFTNDVKPAIESTVTYLQGLWDQWGATIKRVVQVYFGTAVALIKAYVREIRGVFEFVSGILTLNWGKAWAGLKDIAGGALSGVVAVVKGWGQTIAAVFEGIWTNIKVSLLQALQWMAAKLGSIPTKLKTPLGSIGFDNPFKKWADGLQSSIDATKLKKTVERATSDAVKGGPAVDGAARRAGKQVGASIAEGVADGLTKPTTSETQALAGLNSRLKAAVAKQATDVAAAVEQAKQNLTSLGSSLSGALATIIDQPFVLANQKIQDAQDRIALKFDMLGRKLQAQAASISRQQAQIQFGSDKLALRNLSQGVVLPGGKLLSDDPKKGLAALQKLSASLQGGNKAAVDAFILQYRSASLTVQSDRVSLKQSALDAKRSVLTNALQLKSEVLKVQQDTADRMKTQIATQIQDLTDAFNRHVITYAKFKAGIEGIVSKGGPAMRKAGVTLGTAFADQYTQTVSDIIGQAGLIASGPQSSAGTGQANKLVNPGAVAAKDAAAADRIRIQIANKQTRIQERIHAEQKKSNTYLGKIAGETKPVPKSKDKNAGGQSARARVYNGTH